MIGEPLIHHLELCPRCYSHNTIFSHLLRDYEISEEARKFPITPLPAGRQGIGSVSMTLLNGSCP